MNKCRAGLVWVMLMLSFSGPGISQVLDNFGDGDFSQNPRWQGDSLQYKINAEGQLQLYSSGTDTSFLSLPNHLIDSTEWRFWMKLSFSPSANNYARVYLISDQAALNGPLQGYFLQFGQAGTNDAITLYRQAGLDTFRICTGSPGLIAAGFSGNVKITRNSHGKWTIAVDPTGGIQYAFEAEGTDNVLSQTAYFGIQCRFTSSNATKFYFDDFLIREIAMDYDPPEILKVIAKDSHSLDVFVSEPIDLQASGNPQLYNLNQGIGNAMLALPDNLQPGLIHLQFQQALEQAVHYTLNISEIQDIAGNIAYNQAYSFVYYAARQHDIVFNEIMADPEPAQALPAVEYTELYNRTDQPISLGGWQYTWGSSSAVLPDTIIPSKGYLLLCNTSNCSLLSAYGKCLEINGFSLSNTGASLSLRNAESMCISWLTYHPDWIQNPLKQEGGWSLEQIDPFNPCAGAENWQVSMAAAGGSPGAENSIHAENPDVTPPKPIRAFPVDPYHIRLVFSESLDSASLLQNLMFSLNPGNVFPVHTVLFSPDYRQLELEFADSIKHGIIYSLHFLHQFLDCAGNPGSVEDSLQLALPEKPLRGDLVINEILFHPKTGGAEFAELYNLSNKVLDLKDLVIGTYDSLTQALDKYGRISEESKLLFPGEYVVLTDEPVVVQQQYFSPSPGAILQSLYFPALTDAGGILGLSDVSLNLIDKVHFDESMHYPLLANTAGVSLERVRPDANSESNASWHSASAGCGYATPAYKNSQAMEISDAGADFSLQPRVFSPGNDGKNDMIMLKYTLSDPGFTANVTIFNEAGMKVKTLVNNELLGTGGFFVWNGLSDRQTRCADGNYLCYIEIFNVLGNVKKIKKVFAIAGF